MCSRVKVVYKQRTDFERFLMNEGVGEIFQLRSKILPGALRKQLEPHLDRLVSLRIKREQWDYPL